MKERDKKIIALIIVLILGFSLGYGYGFRGAIKFGLSISKSFVTLSFNEAEIADAIWRYKNQIVHCYEE